MNHFIYWKLRKVCDKFSPTFLGNNKKVVREKVDFLIFSTKSQSDRILTKLSKFFIAEVFSHLGYVLNAHF